MSNRRGAVAGQRVHACVKAVQSLPAPPCAGLHHVKHWWVMIPPPTVMSRIVQEFIAPRSMHEQHWVVECGLPESLERQEDPYLTDMGHSLLSVMRPNYC
jgi:hypothetical protein